MKVLVSGANSFVGSALCPFLAALGHEVVSAVRRPCGLFDETIVHDEISWKAALRGCDSVIHLAGLSHVMRGEESNPLPLLRSCNVTTTVDLARRAVEAGARRFVFMSTVKVNGEKTAPGSRFRPEDPADPKDPYAISKWEAEQRLFAAAQQTGLQVVIIRAPLVYGPGVKGNFASLIKLVKNGVPLPFGAVRNRRSMIALDNLISFTALCADIDASPSARDQVFLPSDGKDVSTPELLQKLAEAYGCASRQLSVPVSIMRCAARLVKKSALADRLFGSLTVDNSKCWKMLGWTPAVSMDEQLKKMAQNDSIA